MSQSLPTLTPDNTGQPAKKNGWWPFLILAVLVAVIAGIIIFTRGGGSELHALQAQIEARTLDVRAPMRGVIQSLDVHEGQDFAAGQVLLGYDDSRLRLEYLEAQAGYQAALQGYNPGLPDAAGLDETLAEIRLEIQRLRDVELNAQSEIEQWTITQSQALIAMRNPAATPEARGLAEQAEAQAANNLDLARQGHENAVRDRQRAEGRLQALRDMAANVSGQDLAQLWQARYLAAERALASASVTAPQAGRAVRVNARAGERTAPDDVLLSYVPEGFVQENYWVTAVFGAEDLPALEIGLPCKVETGDSVFRGRISGISIDPDFVRVHIQLDPGPDQAKLYAGQLAKVDVELP